MRTDVLILGLARAKHGFALAGMTTDPDPVTGLRWVRPIKQGTALTVDDVRYEDGTFIRLGDVVQLELVQPQPTPPHVENVIADWSNGPPAFIRDLNETRRASFFSKHLDPAPGDVLVRRQRSLCLVQPDTLEAVFSYDEELDRFEARLMPRIGRLHSEDGVPVFDPYWRAWGRQQLGTEEYIEFDHAQLQEMLGQIYLTLSLNARGKAQVIGVHTTPAYQIDLDELK